MENNLYQALSIADLEVLLAKYADDKDILAMIEPEYSRKLADKVAGEEEEKFGEVVADLTANLPHPENIHNVFLGWSILDTEGKPVDGHWKATINYVTQVGVGRVVKGTPRGITLWFRDGTNMTAKGVFASAEAACKELHLATGGDSAIRVLNRNGYLVEKTK